MTHEAREGDLITALALKQQFSADDVWQQIRLAYEQNYTNVGSKLVDALGNQRPDPVLFDQAASTPPLLLARGVGPDSQSHQLALLAITRMARNDPAMAAATFASVAPSLSSPPTFGNDHS